MIFATLEDEIGTVNIIVWPSVAEAQRQALRGSTLPSAQGIWQSEKGVHSRVAQKLVNHDLLLWRLRAASRISVSDAGLVRACSRTSKIDSAHSISDRYRLDAVIRLRRFRDHSRHRRPFGAL